MTGRASARDLGRRRTARAERILDACEALDLRNASDDECKAIIDGCAIVARADIDPVSLDAALDALEDAVARVARRRRPWRSPKRWRTHATVTREGQPMGRTDPPKPLRKALEPPPVTTPSSVDNVFPFAPRRRGPVSPRAWRSQRSRSGESLTRGIESEEF